VAIIYPYQTPQVRDLAWSCFSAPLLLTSQINKKSGDVDNCALQLTAQRSAWLEALDRDASPLLSFLAENPATRLGLYFEKLWHFFLREDPDTDLVAHNLPVNDRGRTVGEFDCIYYCRERRCHVHLELAVKFYLGYQSHSTANGQAEMSDWLGPNSQDRLDKKVDHLMQRQIRLGEHEAARSLLQALGIGALRQEVELKGYLFSHFQQALLPPGSFNDKRRPGHWLQLAQLDDFLQGGQARVFRALPGMRWLSSANSNDPGENLDTKSLRDVLERQFSEQPRPVLVAALDSAGIETDRFFVTGPDWPDAN
jgi:hypothetical protein